MKEASSLLSSQILMLNPIEIGGINLYQPTVESYLKMGDMWMQSLTMPFSNINIFRQQLDLGDDMEDIDIFFELNESKDNYLCILKFGEQEIPLIQFLIESIKFFTKSEDVYIDMKSRQIIVGKDLIIDRNNFDDICEAILRFFDNKKIEIRKPQVFTNEKQRKIHEKLEAGRKRKENLADNDFVNIINVVYEHCKSYELIYKMTYLKLINAYKIAQAKECSKVKLAQLSSGMYDPKELDITYWWNELNKKS